MRNRILMMILTVTMLFGLLAIPAAAADTYSLKVGGVQVTSENCTDVLGDGSVKYDPSSRTLTLSGAEITNDAGHGINYYGGDALTVTLEGENSITASKSAIYSDTSMDTPLTINGDGSLKATGDSSYHCIHTVNTGCNIEIAGGASVTVTSGDFGISSNNDVIISTSGTVDVTGDRVGMIATGDIQLTGTGTVTAKGSGEAFHASNGSISCPNHFITAPAGTTVSGGQVKVGEELAKEVTFAYDTPYQLYIGGKQVRQSFCDDVFGDGTVSYDPCGQCADAEWGEYRR